MLIPPAAVGRSFFGVNIALGLPIIRTAGNTIRALGTVVMNNLSAPIEIIHLELIEFGSSTIAVMARFARAALAPSLI